MKKYTTAAIIALSVGLAMTLIGAILLGVRTLNTGTPDFSITTLATTLRDLGYVIAALSGIVLVACGVSTAVRGSDDKK